MDPALSLCAAGKGWVRGRRRVNHSHTQSQFSWGDRASGFNDLRTSGPPGLHPGRGTGKGPRQEALPSDDELSPGCPSSTNVSLIFSRTSVSGLLGFSEAGKS